MNERMLQLAKDAGFENGHQDRDGRSLSDELAKFAELIVRDCAVQCEIIANMATITNTGEMARKTQATADSCAREIKQYFGVE